MSRKSDRIAVSVNGLSFTGSVKLAYDLFVELGGEAPSTYRDTMLDRLWESLKKELTTAGVLDAKGHVIKVPEL